MDSDEWTIENSLFDNATIMTNVAEDGSVTTIHNDVSLENVTIDDIFSLFRVYPIGFQRNEEVHLYRFYPDADQVLGTVEWNTMDDLRYNVYVPCYPMLLTDTWEGFQISVGDAVTSEEEPAPGDYYVKDGVYHVYPEGWENSYYWTMDALSNAMTYGDVSEEDQELVTTQLLGLQTELEEKFEDITSRIIEAGSLEEQQEIMTAAAAEMSRQVHDLALGLYQSIRGRSLD